MRLASLSRLLLAVALVALPATARAQFVVYSDLASFLAATSNAGTDTFDDIAVFDAPASPLNRLAGGYAYSATVNTTSFFGTGSVSDTWLSTNTSTDIITFSGFGSTVRGIGGFFFGSDANGGVRPGTNLFLSATNIGGTTMRTLVDATVGSFLGFVSGSDIVSLTVEAELPTVDFAWPTVNDLVIAEAPVATVVPEPSSLALMLVGAGGLFVAARRRTRG